MQQACSGLIRIKDLALFSGASGNHEFTVAICPLNTKDSKNIFGKLDQRSFLDFWSRFLASLETPR